MILTIPETKNWIPGSTSRKIMRLPGWYQNCQSCSQSERSIFSWGFVEKSFFHKLPSSQESSDLLHTVPDSQQFSISRNPKLSWFDQGCETHQSGLPILHEPSPKSISTGVSVGLNWRFMVKMNELLTIEQRLGGVKALIMLCGRLVIVLFLLKRLLQWCENKGGTRRKRLQERKHS